MTDLDPSTRKAFAIFWLLVLGALALVLIAALAKWLLF